MDTTSNLSYEEAIKILQEHSTKVVFPIKEQITHNFIKEQLYTSLPIGNLDIQTKSALAYVLNQAGLNSQLPEKEIEIPQYHSHKILSHTIQQQKHKESKITTKQEYKHKAKQIIEPLIKKEQININPDKKIWEDNMKIIRGIESTDENRKRSLVKIHDLIKKYMPQSYNQLFIGQYTKPDSQNNNEIVYRIQHIKMDIFSKSYQKSTIQKIMKDIEVILDTQQ